MRGPASSAPLLFESSVDTTTGPLSKSHHRASTSSGGMMGTMRASPTAIDAIHHSDETDVDNNTLHRTHAVTTTRLGGSGTGSYDDDDDDVDTLGFPPSSYFRFASEFAVEGDDVVGNNDVLPVHAMSPTNQTTHDDEMNEREDDDAALLLRGRRRRVVMMTGATTPTPTPTTTTSAMTGKQSTSTSSSRPHMIHTSVASRRKNSIEMFLSQSPSQALGGGFLKMALDDNSAVPAADLKREPTPEATSTSHGSGGGGSGGGASARFLMNQGGDTDDEWSSTSSQDLSTTTTSATVAGQYYGEHPPPQQYHGHHHQRHQQSTSLYQQPPPQQQQYYGTTTSPAMYRDSYQAPTRQASALHQAASWSSGLAHQQHASSAYAMGGQYPQQQEHQLHPSQQQVPYLQQQQQQQYVQQASYTMGTGGFRGANRTGNVGFGRSQSASGLYQSRSMQSTAVHHGVSGVSGLFGGASGGATGPSGAVKQCKFFLQGHCRMGNKCKFVHHLASGGSGVMAQPPSYHQAQHHQQQQQHVAYHVDYHQQALQVPSPFVSNTPAIAMLPPQEAELGAHFGAFPTVRSHSSSALRGVGGGYLRSGMDMSQQQHSSHDQQHHSHHHHHRHGAASAVRPIVGSGGSSGVATGAASGSSADAVLTLEDIQHRVFAMSKDQNGCRLLQEQLDFYDERKELCDVIYYEAMDHLAEMMVDPFGNYLFQKLLERAKPLDRLDMIRRVSGNLVAAALNLHGTRSVQKVVEVCATSAEVVELDSDGNERRRVFLPDLIVAALEEDAVRLCIDSNGNHVIQRALQFMKPEYNQFVFDAVCGECTTVGTHRHGCCVLQRCLDAANPAQKRQVIAQVEKQVMKLMQDPYGNYVVQYVLDSCSPEEALGVMLKPLGHVFELSIQKFSSNVIEKCLEKAPAGVLEQYVDEITHCPKMQKMLQDQFANYVVQRALCVAVEEQCLALVKAIRPHLAAMKNTSGGRRITARILKRFPHMDLNLDLGFDPHVGLGGGAFSGGMMRGGGGAYGGAFGGAANGMMGASGRM